MSTCMWLLAGAANGSANPDVMPKGHAANQAVSTGSAAGSSDVSPAASAVELTHMELASADLPQADMDPEAGLLNAAPAKAALGGRDDGCAVVLTTHSMEEVEVLCSRVGIMHRGRLACLGSPQRLKALYGGAWVWALLPPQHDSPSQGVKCVWARASFG